MKKSLLIVNLLSIYGFSNAQEFTKSIRKGSTELSINSSAVYYLNNMSVKHELSTKQLSAQNTVGLNFGIDIQRNTKYGFTYGLGIGHSSAPQHINADINDYSYFIDNPTPDQLNQLSKINYHNHLNYNINVLYLKPHFGFLIPLDKHNKWALATQLSYVTTCSYKKGLYYSFYEELDNGTITSLATKQEYRINSASISNTVAYYYSAYIGLDKKIKAKFINKLHFGFDFNYATFNMSNNVSMLLLSLKGDGSLYALDEYNFRNISVGFRLGLGIGK